MKPPSEFNKAKALALKLLAIREHSVLQLAQKLERKGHEIACVRAVITALLADNLLSDTRFAESFVIARIRKGYGPIFIAAALRQYGIDKQLIQQALSEKAGFWSEHIQTVWRKRFGGKLPQDTRARLQQIRFLQYRGFPVPEIERMLQEMSQISV